MIRLTARPYEDEFAFTISRDGIDLFTTTDPVEAAQRMRFLRIDNQMQLIEEARYWRVVEIREYEIPPWV